MELTTTLEAELAAIAEARRTRPHGPASPCATGAGTAAAAPRWRRPAASSTTSRASACASCANGWRRSSCRRRAAAPALEHAPRHRRARGAHHGAPSLARRLADEHVAARPFDPAGLLTAAAVLGLRRDLHRSTRSRTLRVALPDPPDPATDTRAVVAGVVDTARALVRRGGRGARARRHGPGRAPLAVWVDDDLRHGRRLRARRLRVARAPHRLVLPAVRRQERRGVARRQGAQRRRRGSACTTCTPASAATSACASSSCPSTSWRSCARASPA